eukprot:jgi/Mesen1/10933/ME000095S10264
MAKGILVHKPGGPEVLQWEDTAVGEPGEGEVRLRHTAIGLNFIDTYFRAGVMKPPAYPFTPGLEAAGVVTAVGPGRTGRVVGDRVGYCLGPSGAYCQERVIAAERLIPLPSGIDDMTAAGSLLKGLTAHMLLRRVFQVEAGHTILVHAAAGGVGSLLCQWAKALGATVIGTVSSAEKAQQAARNGCHHVIDYAREDFVQRVKEITGAKGVDVVYDSVGKDTFMGSLDCLKARGFMVNYGQSSGPPPPFTLADLGSRGSLFLTRANLFDYGKERDELLKGAGELFAVITSGAVSVRVNHTYALLEAATAHADLASRKTTGSIVLMP